VGCLFLALLFLIGSAITIVKRTKDIRKQRTFGPIVAECRTQARFGVPEEEAAGSFAGKVLVCKEDNSLYDLSPNLDPSLLADNPEELRSVVFLRIRNVDVGFYVSMGSARQGYQSPTMTRAYRTEYSVCVVDKNSRRAVARTLIVGNPPETISNGSQGTGQHEADQRLAEWINEHVGKAGVETTQAKDGRGNQADRKQENVEAGKTERGRYIQDVADQRPAERTNERVRRPGVETAQAKERRGNQADRKQEDVETRKTERGRHTQVESRDRPVAEVTVVSTKERETATEARAERITVRVPPGFRVASGAAPESYTNTGWAKEVIHEKGGIEMAFIPAGEFKMGADSAYNNEKPVHGVRLTKPFYLGKYEVTQGEWQKVTGANPSKFKGDRNPVECVSWNDCQDFLRKAGDGLRLPTEAEWEYACRAGTTGAFYFGDTIGTDSANYDGNYTYGNGGKGVYRQRTVEVGSFRSNAWGLYDMHGNVWEWCKDWYATYPPRTVEDPQGPSSGQFRVLRGGSWVNGPRYCRSAYRDFNDPAGAVCYRGLRVARTIE